jgi:hypothetical protein
MHVYFESLELHPFSQQLFSPEVSRWGRAVAVAAGTTITTIIMETSTTTVLI